MPHKDPEERRAYMRTRYKAIREGSHTVHNGGTPRAGKGIVCDECGKEFYRSPANRLRNGTNQYCSRECMSSAYVGRNIGEEHPRWTGRITKPCTACGTLLSRPIWSFTRNPDQMVFCNSHCFGIWKSQNWNGETNPCWRGGHPPYYGANWLRQARETRYRDGHVCRFCGLSENVLRRALNVHHIRPFRFFGVDNCKEANKLANLVSLCDSCHTYLERFCQDGTVHDWPTLLHLGQTNRQTR